MPQPFLVLATQNPIESEGVYPLPEAQRDRFLMKVLVGYPDRREEAEIVRRMGVDPPQPERVLDPDAPRDAADGGRRGLRPRRACSTTRSGSCSRTGRRPSTASATWRRSSPTAPAPGPRSASSPPAGRSPCCGAATYVLPQDVFDVARDVLRHRVLLSYEALADGVDAEQVVEPSSPPSSPPGSPRARTTPTSSSQPP